MLRFALRKLDVLTPAVARILHPLRGVKPVLKASDEQYRTCSVYAQLWSSPKMQVTSNVRIIHDLDEPFDFSTRIGAPGALACGQRIS